MKRLNLIICFCLYCILMLANNTTVTIYTIPAEYFSEWDDDAEKTVYVNVQRSNNEGGDRTGDIEMAATVMQEGKQVYKATFEELWGGAAKFTFKLSINNQSYTYDCPAPENSGNWMSADNWKDKVYIGWKDDTHKWIDFTPDKYHSTEGRVFYFDNSVTQWPSVWLRIGRSQVNGYDGDYCSSYAFERIEGTDLWYLICPDWQNAEAWTLTNSSENSNDNISIYSLPTSAERLDFYRQNIDDDMYFAASTKHEAASGETWYETTRLTDMPSEVTDYQDKYKGQYRIRIHTADDRYYYSNSITATDAVMSFYADTEGEILLQDFSNNRCWMNTVINKSIFADGNNVYCAFLNAAKDGIEDVSLYSGNYYVKGLWNNYAPDQLGYTAESSAAEEPYYRMERLDAGKAYTCYIANEYNGDLAGILEADELTGSGTGIPQAANMRIGYNPRTNLFRRRLLAESTEDNYLFVRLNNDQEREVTFHDIGAWVYETTATIKAAESADLYYEYNSLTNNITTCMPIGEGSSAGSYRVHLIYDFKTLSYKAMWYPQDETISENKTIKSSALFLRNANSEVNTCTLADEVKVDGLQQITLAFRIKRGDLSESPIYWLSLPFDCRMEDIYGIDGYGSKWIMQYYDGKERSEIGYLNYNQTFWKYVAPTDVLNRGEGYVLIFNPNRLTYASEDENEYLQLYFTSTEAENTLTSEVGTLECQEYKCQISGREEADSNWHLIGIPSVNNLFVSSYAGASEVPQFLYEWDYNGGEQRYTVRSATTDFVYKPFYSYMVQWAGEIQWDRYTTQNKIVARRKVAQNEPAMLCLSVQLKQDDTMLDQTYISLNEDATTGYDLNMDLEKIINQHLPQIYTTDSHYSYAANVLPIGTTVVPLTIYANADGYYDILGKYDSSDYECYLSDNQTGTTWRLTESATIYLQQGLTTGRYTIRLSTSSITTALDVPIEATGQYCRKVLQNGTIYIITANGKKFNLLGQSVR